MKKIFSELYDEISKERDAVLVELTASSGSTPRGAGAKMLVFSEESDKKSVGTIGGGRVEFLCTEAAKNAISQKNSFIKGYDLSINDVEDVGMICGGNVEACFKYFSDADIHFVEHVLEVIRKNVSAWLVTRIGSAGIDMGTYDENNGLMFIKGISDNEIKGMLNSKYSFEYNGEKYFIEPISEKGRVYVFGAGHVSRELVPLIEHVGFKTAVYEQRRELVEGCTFSAETEVYDGEFGNIDKYIKMNENDYAVVMTSGHKADFEVLEQVLRKKLTYVGVIGSRKKINITRKRLLEAGVDEAEIDKLHTPIGLAIKAETPAEIAVSVAAELILHRAENR
ncbi:MAG: XdhC/CoxI family protein [Candidatus Metalachnospira sp.]|nr:XdhC/CoxI family protein [Candidatus Metalachnospira sp.]